MRRGKYNAQPTVVDGVRFASKAEAKRDAELVLLQRGGKIERLMRQRAFTIKVGGVKICKYVSDWSYVENGKHVVEDKKGVQTPAFRLKWKLVKALFPDIEWRLS